MILPLKVKANWIYFITCKQKRKTTSNTEKTGHKLRDAKLQVLDKW